MTEPYELPTPLSVPATTFLYAQLDSFQLRVSPSGELFATGVLTPYRIDGSTTTFGRSIELNEKVSALLAAFPDLAPQFAIAREALLELAVSVAQKRGRLPS